MADYGQVAGVLAEVYGTSAPLGRTAGALGEVYGVYPDLGRVSDVITETFGTLTVQEARVSDIIIEVFGSYTADGYGPGKVHAPVTGIPLPDADNPRVLFPISLFYR